MNNKFKYLSDHRLLAVTLNKKEKIFKKKERTTQYKLDPIKYNIEINQKLPELKQEEIQRQGVQKTYNQITKAIKNAINNAKDETENLEEPNPIMMKLRKEIKDLRKPRIIILKTGKKTPKEKNNLKINF